MQEHPNALPSGTRLFDYLVDSVLGDGAFGITYYAHDLQDNRPVAIKEYFPGEYVVRVDGQTITPRSQEDQDNYYWGKQRFIDEAHALARFDHPNINHVLQIFEANDTAYMVLEYIQGDTLSSVLRSGKSFSESELLRLLLALSSGLLQVHRAGYVHRDIKPANIILRQNGVPVLIDFGAARQAIGRKTGKITSVFTPGYAPVEQYVQDVKDVGPWTDIYALGMVAYRCITNCPERILVGSVERSMALNEDGREDPLPEITGSARGVFSDALLDAVRWAIQVRKEDRPQDLQDWMRVLQGDMRAPGTKASGQKNHTGAAADTLPEENHYVVRKKISLKQAFEGARLMVKVPAGVCKKCHGDPSQKNGCDACKGSGFSSRKKKVSIDIPAGAKDGQRILLNPGSKQDKNQDAKVYLEVSVESDDSIWREGRNLYVKARISEYTARFGGEMEVSVFGRIYRVIVPDNTRDGDLLRLEGAGNGSLYCKISVGGKDLNEVARDKLDSKGFPVWLTVVLVVLVVVSIALAVYYKIIPT